MQRFDRLSTNGLLDPPIPLHVLGKGDGYALAVIDYGPEHDLLWVTAINATGEIWCAPNPKVRMQANWSLGRPKSAPARAAKEGLSDVCADCAGAVADSARPESG